MRKMTYTNPCDSTTFFNDAAVTLVFTQLFVPGILQEQQDNLGARTPDTVSNTLGSTDNYSYCNQARVYTLAPPPAGTSFALFKMSTTTRELMQTQLATAHTTEIIFTSAITVDLKIGGVVIDTVSGTLTVDVSCKHTGVMQLVSGDTTDLTMVLRAAPISFTWVITYPNHCAYLYTIKHNQDEDIDDILTITPVSVVEVVNGNNIVKVTT